MKNLHELSDFIKKTPLFNRYSMNEVNAHFSIRDLVGLFVNDQESAIPQLEILLVQRMVKEKYHLDLPIYVYDSKNGCLSPFKTNVSRLLIELRGQKGISFTQNVAQMLGYSMSDNGSLRKMKPLHN
ncbi:MAG TPA: hypothetical protein VLG76_08330 [Rhabdochlamydiaceae bacterium]|nr:hypothetical protein [Rhabdochlamydiaceae bacterium]HSX38660.1 hypothetical protein [Chlamydiales bacterium]